MAAYTRTMTPVHITAGAGRDVHWGIEIKDSDAERAFPVHGTECGSDSGRRGSVRAFMVTEAPITCGKCLKRNPKVITVDMGERRTFTPAAEA